MQYITVLLNTNTKILLIGPINPTDVYIAQYKRVYVGCVLNVDWIIFKALCSQGHIQKSIDQHFPVFLFLSIKMHFFFSLRAVNILIPYISG